MKELTKKEERLKNKYPDTETFVWYNANEKHAIVCDCVIRAITKALNSNWYMIFDELCEYGEAHCDMPNSKSVYSKWLEKNGFIKHKQPRHSDNTKYTGDEFAKEFNKGTYVLNMANHLTVCVDGKIYDTWNCGYKTVGNYWEKVK